MKATQTLHNLGQSIWLDNITRELLDSGTLKRYISVSVRLHDAGYCPVLPGSSRMARRPASRPGHGPQR